MYKYFGLQLTEHWTSKVELNPADNNVNSFQQNYFYLNLIIEGGGFHKSISLQFELQKQNNKSEIIIMKHCPRRIC